MTTYLNKSLFLYCLVLYVTLIVTAFATASKLVALPFGLSASISTVTCYAFTFVITDIVSEIYGYKASKMLVQFGFVSATTALLIFQLAVQAPPAVGFESQAAFEQTLGYPYRIILGGLLGYFFSQQVDIFIYHRLKKMTGGRMLWLRNNVSTLCGQFVDSCIWISIAFAGVVPSLLSLITGEYLVKACVALLDTAVIYAIAIIFLHKYRSCSLLKVKQV